MSQFSTANEGLEMDGNSIQSNPDKFRIFEQWLVDNGSTFPKLELKDYGNEVRGCHAVENVREEEIIVMVPLKCLITVEMGKETEVGKIISVSNIDLDAPKHIYLMIFMLIDRKRPDSFFKPYYDILPPTLSNMPIFWTADELAMLEGSYMIQQIDERNVAIEADYAAICCVVPNFPSIATLDEFKWARMCVCSRNFGLIANNIRTAALVPYADMLNHYRPRETKWQFDDTLQGFTITSLQQISVGAQVYDSYGQKCNHRFLLNYGFSVENNVEENGFCPNEYPFLVELKRQDPLFSRKCEVWKRDSCLPIRRLRVCVSDNDSTRVLFALLRVIEADADDIDGFTAGLGCSSSYRSIRDAYDALHVRNELRAMKALECMCSEGLERFPSSLEQDCERLAAEQGAPLALPMYSNERHAVIQVKGEKQVLVFYQQFARHAQRLLTIREDEEFRQEMETLANDRSSVLLYGYAKKNVIRLRSDEERRMGMGKIDYSKPTVV